MKRIKVDGEWLGIGWAIQPMCSKPGHSWQGPCFCLHALFIQNALYVFLLQKNMCIIKNARPRGLRSAARRLDTSLPLFCVTRTV